MGLFSKLALLPLSPVFGVVWLSEQLEKVAAEELEGAGAQQRDLLELQIARDEGTIDDAEYEAAAASILERMTAASDGDGPGLRP